MLGALQGRAQIREAFGGWVAAPSVQRRLVSTLGRGRHEAVPSGNAAGAGLVGRQVRLSGTAQLISLTRNRSWGKLPQSSPVRGSMSADSSPEEVARLSISLKSARASPSRPVKWSASISQKVQTLKAVSGRPKSSLTA